MVEVENCRRRECAIEMRAQSVRIWCLRYPGFDTSTAEGKNAYLRREISDRNWSSKRSGKSFRGCWSKVWGMEIFDLQNMTFATVATILIGYDTLISDLEIANFPGFFPFFKGGFPCRRCRGLPSKRWINGIQKGMNGCQLSKNLYLDGFHWRCTALRKWLKQR